MNTSTKLQQVCLLRLDNWPRHRCRVNCNGDRLEYGDITIEQTIGKDQFDNDITAYKVTMDGVPVPNNADIDRMCREIFRQYHKMDIVTRENLRSAAMGGACFIGFYALLALFFTLVVSQCGWEPPLDDDYGYYMITKNNTKPAAGRPERKIGPDELNQWYAAYNRMCMANNMPPQKTR